MSLRVPRFVTRLAVVAACVLGVLGVLNVPGVASAHHRRPSATATPTLVPALTPVPTTTATATATSPSAGGTTYYMDCNGSDNNNGTSPSTPWQSLSKASSAPLNPGDSLLFNRGCTWTGSFSVSRSGASGNVILVGAYGSGALPTFTSSTQATSIIDITGSYVTVDSLYAEAQPNGYATGCNNAPTGWVVGFGLEDGAQHDIIQNSEATGGWAGVNVTSGASYDTIQDNQLLNNTMMSPDDLTPNNDSGAYGVALHGSNNIVQHNTINGSFACSYDFGTDGSAVEVYGGASNTIQYNSAHEDDAFSEITETSPNNADSNVYAYNLYWSDVSNSIFVNQHGNVYSTGLYNNTAYLTGSSSQGFVVSGPGSALSRNNIFDAAWKVGYADSGTLSEDYDLLWPSSAQQQFAVGAHSKTADPQFVSPTTGDFHLLSTSPAIGLGVNLGYTVDLDGKPVTNPPDAGAYQH